VLYTSVEVVASNANEWRAAGLELPRFPRIYFGGHPDALDAPMDIASFPPATRWNPAEPIPALQPKASAPVLMQAR
jgi:hypothetical protein